MDFKKAVVPLNTRNGKSKYKKRTARVVGTYPDLKVKLRGGKVLDIVPKTIKIDETFKILYSTPENTHYSNWTKHNFIGTQTLLFDIIEKFWSVIRPNQQVVGNITMNNTFSITKIKH